MNKQISFKKYVMLTLKLCAIAFTVIGVAVFILYLSGNSLYGVEDAYNIYKYKGNLNIETTDRNLDSGKEIGNTPICSGIKYKNWCLGKIHRRI